MAGWVLCSSSSSTMMRSISWWEMSIVNESSIADPKPSASTFSKSFFVMVPGAIVIDAVFDSDSEFVILCRWRAPSAIA